VVRVRLPERLHPLRLLGLLQVLRLRQGPLEGARLRVVVLVDRQAAAPLPQAVEVARVEEKQVEEEAEAVPRRLPGKTAGTPTSHRRG
jgi:hypothetical protein